MNISEFTQDHLPAWPWQHPNYPEGLPGVQEATSDYPKQIGRDFAPESITAFIEESTHGATEPLKKLAFAIEWGQRVLFRIGHATASTTLQPATKDPGNGVRERKIDALRDEARTANEVFTAARESAARHLQSLEREVRNVPPSGRNEQILIEARSALRAMSPADRKATIEGIIKAYDGVAAHAIQAAPAWMSGLTPDEVNEFVTEFNKQFHASSHAALAQINGALEVYDSLVARFHRLVLSVLDEDKWPTVQLGEEAAPKRTRQRVATG